MATCEVCGAPSTGIVEDAVEGEPILDDNGSWWRTWEADGQPHHFCEAHKRLPRFRHSPELTGPVEEQIRQEHFAKRENE